MTADELDLARRDVEEIRQHIGDGGVGSPLLRSSRDLYFHAVGISPGDAVARCPGNDFYIQQY